MHISIKFALILRLIPRRFIFVSISGAATTIRCNCARFLATTRLDCFRYLPHGILVEVVLEIAKVGDNSFVFLVGVGTANENGLSEVWRRKKSFVKSYPVLNRFILTTMLYCCQRFMKLIDPSGNESELPMWTKVKSCKTNPL